MNLTREEFDKLTPRGKRWVLEKLSPEELAEMLGAEGKEEVRMVAPTAVIPQGGQEVQKGSESADDEANPANVLLLLGIIFLPLIGLIAFLMTVNDQRRRQNGMLYLAIAITMTVVWTVIFVIMFSSTN